MACEFCDRPGCMDLTSPPFYRRVGRRNQGAMTPLYAPAEYSPTLDAVVCAECFKRHFYRKTSLSTQWPVA